MELPKNIVQIGKPDRTHKIFVEDYVVSYIKQINRDCDNKTVGLALYGKYYEENDCKYYFLYGAAKIEGLLHGGPYLSQMEQEEIADIEKKFFEEYRFLAWCNLKGEPVEGFYVQSQGKGMKVDGYACFYEKNESMLSYMLQTEQKKEAKGQLAVQEQSRSEETSQPVGRGEWKAEDIRKPLEQSVKRSVPVKRNAIVRKTEYMKVAAAAVFLVLCVVGVTTLNDYEKLEDLQVAARQIIASMTEQKLPDSPDDLGTISDVSANEVSFESQMQPTVPAPVELQEKPVVQTPVENQVQQEVQPAEESVAAPLPVSYTIAKGDTLISICRQKYGTLERLSEICELNGITNADSIQVGQTILLP